MLDDFPSLDDGRAQDLVGRVDIDDNVANNVLKHHVVVGAHIVHQPAEVVEELGAVDLVEEVEETTFYADGDEGLDILRIGLLHEERVLGLALLLDLLDYAA